MPVSSPSPSLQKSLRPALRFWPAWLILLVTALTLAGVRSYDGISFQKRNLTTLVVGVVALSLLLGWWLGFSRSRGRGRWGVPLALVLALALGAGLFRVRGVSGDLVPIWEPRWVRSSRAPKGGTVAVEIAGGAAIVNAPRLAMAAAAVGRPDFPQFLGPDRNAVLAGPALAADWVAHPPEILWRSQVGAGWSGFVVVGARALTQEQAGPRERVTCRDLFSGAVLWSHEDEARYDNPIGGEGPRATPTVVGNRVYTLGSTGRLNALELATGQVKWTRDIVGEAGSQVPDWGCAGSPLFLEGRIIVSAGGKKQQSLIAYQADTGERVWAAGEAAASYGSPMVMTLAGRRQIVVFNHRRITGHDAVDGAVLWEHPFGAGQPHVAVPVVVGPDRVVFSAGYGVGSELLKVSEGAGGKWGAEVIWRSLKMKAKFANPVARAGYLYGLDDGMLACLDLKDGSQVWKEGRLGHGQGLWVGDLYLLMAENGELVLMRPSAAGANELHRFRVFAAKTWNPIALAGDVLLVRNDQEAVALRVTLAKNPEAGAL